MLLTALSEICMIFYIHLNARPGDRSFRYPFYASVCFFLTIHNVSKINRLLSM